MPAKSRYRFRDMRLRVGDRVQIEPPAQLALGRVSCKVVGWVEGESLILTVPYTSAGRLCLQAGENVIVRAFTGRSAFAFGCSVLRSTTPGGYLHLSYPAEVDGVDVRSSPRFRVQLPARAVPAGLVQPVEATIDNIGTTGALVVSATPLGAVGDSLELAFDIVLHDVPVSLGLASEIRTWEQGGDGQTHRHGVAFVDPSPNDRLVLAALVWFNMYENPRLAT